jgi:hypothetical protein
VPTESTPVVVTTPVEETLIPPEDPGAGEVVVKVTAPALPVVVSVSVNDELLAGVVEFENGAVWVIVFGVGGGGGGGVPPVLVSGKSSGLGVVPGQVAATS